MGLLQNFNAVGNFLLDQVIPPTCLSCKTPVGNSASLCSACWQSLTFVSKPYCQVCGQPFDVEDHDNQLCGKCIGRQPPYSRLRSALVYDDESRSMILSFKHGDQLNACPTFTKWLSTTDPSLFDNLDTVTAVPLHWQRLFRRRYNQSAMMSNALSKGIGVKSIPDLLVRERNTPSQGHLTRSQRKTNVRGAFSINKRYTEYVSAKTILLIDDVLTTGATIEACCRTLTKAGAAEVRVLTLARAVNPAG